MLLALRSQIIDLIQTRIAKIFLGSGFPRLIVGRERNQASRRHRLLEGARNNLGVGNRMLDDLSRSMDRGLFDAAVAINTLRNKQGTGHGRPWPTELKQHEARTAIRDELSRGF